MLTQHSLLWAREYLSQATLVKGHSRAAKYRHRPRSCCIAGFHFVILSRLVGQESVAAATRYYPFARLEGTMEQRICLILLQIPRNDRLSEMKGCAVTVLGRSFLEIRQERPGHRPEGGRFLDFGASWRRMWMVYQW
jgi:hypothetical protein